MSEKVKYRVVNHVAVLLVDNPPVNALSQGVPEAIEAAIQRASQDDDAQAIVIGSEGRTFIAGADIGELQQIADGKAEFTDALQSFLYRIESVDKPLIAALHGSVLGGGLEVAMACHYRIAMETTRLGQPEVNLGLIPGAAGTQRLPRLVGTVMAARMCALGQPISAAEAKQCRLVDRLAGADLLAEATQFAEELTKQQAAVRRTRDLPLSELSSSDDVELNQLIEETKLNRPAEIAPSLAVKAVSAAASLDFEEGCQFELECFDQCMKGTQARPMIRAFFGRRKVETRIQVAEKNPYDRLRLIGEFDDRFVSVLRRKADKVGISLELDSGSDATSLFPTPAETLTLFSEGQGLTRLKSFLRSSAGLNESAHGDFACLLPREEQAVFEEVETTWFGVSPFGRLDVVERYLPASRQTSSVSSRTAQFWKSLRTGIVDLAKPTEPVWWRWIQAMKRSWTESRQPGLSKGVVMDAMRDHGFRRDVIEYILDSDSLEGEREHAAPAMEALATENITRMIQAGCTEAVAMVEADVVDDPLKVDMLMINECGYPSSRGGPWWEATQT